MRITHVKKARNDQGHCRNCGTEIKAGNPYRWIKPRYGSKHVRCMNDACRFRNSHLISNDKVASFFAACESVEDAIVRARNGSWRSDGDDTIASFVAQIAEETKDNVEMVADEYEENASNLEDAFPNDERIDEYYEKAECLREAVETFNDAVEKGIEDAQSHRRDNPDHPADDDMIDAMENALEDLQSAIDD